VSGYLLDVNVLSETLKVAANEGVLQWFEETPESWLWVSVITLGEVRKGIVRLPPSRKRDRYEWWLEVELRQQFAGRVLSVDEEVADVWGRLLGEGMAKGTPVPAVDTLLAATALVHGLTLVTRNTRDIAGTGVRTVNPWLGG